MHEKEKGGVICFTRDTRDEEGDERKGSLYVHKVLFIGVYGRSYGQRYVLGCKCMCFVATIIFSLRSFVYVRV